MTCARVRRPCDDENRCEIMIYASPREGVKRRRWHLYLFRFFFFFAQGRKRLPLFNGWGGERSRPSLRRVCRHTTFLRASEGGANRCVVNYNIIMCVCVVRARGEENTRRERRRKKWRGGEKRVGTKKNYYINLLFIYNTREQRQ